MLKNQTVDVSSRVDLPLLAETLVDSLAPEDLVAFIVYLDQYAADWGFTKSLMDKFGSKELKKLYRAECKGK